MRTFLDPNDPADVAAACAAQDGLRIEQPGGLGVWEAPPWDKTSQEAPRKALGALVPFAEFKNGFGAGGRVEPVARLVAAAAG